MKFLVDAQLPKRLCRLLEEAGHEARHTIDLPLANRTPDHQVCDESDREQCVLISKDDDFVITYIGERSPSKLLFDSTGNISNDELCQLFTGFLSEIELALDSGSFVELTRSLLIIHE
jgi:predicted nuclease of predicted toxin-antitoxin system